MSFTNSDILLDTHDLSVCQILPKLDIATFAIAICHFWQVWIWLEFGRKIFCCFHRTGGNPSKGQYERHVDLAAVVEYYLLFLFS